MWQVDTSRHKYATCIQPKTHTCSHERRLPAAKPWGARNLGGAARKESMRCCVQQSVGVVHFTRGCQVRSLSSTANIAKTCHAKNRGFGPAIRASPGLKLPPMEPSTRLNCEHSARRRPASSCEQHILPTKNIPPLILPCQFHFETRSAMS